MMNPSYSSSSIPSPPLTPTPSTSTQRKSLDFKRIIQMQTSSTSSTTTHGTAISTFAPFQRRRMSMDAIHQSQSQSNGNGNNVVVEKDVKTGSVLKRKSLPVVVGSGSGNVFMTRGTEVVVGGRESVD
ncbi:hypothetical protein HDU76_007204, partial [Blyttiomyces sp. JEL0837]